MIVLAFDPGTATTGYAALEKRSNEKLCALDFGVIRTDPGETAPIRLLRIHEEVNRLIELHHPVSVATERLFFKQNETTAMAVGRAIGVILLAIASHGLPWTEYTPVQVKKAVTGVGNADKAQVQWMVTRLLALSETPKPDDAADALAVAICHAHSARAISLGLRSR
jgi:crossover junction endodeoxyribonuclease RuvC